MMEFKSAFNHEILKDNPCTLKVKTDKVHGPKTTIYELWNLLC